MKIFHGRIVAADKNEGTVTIQPDHGIVNGIVIGEEVNIVPVLKAPSYIDPEAAERQPGE